MIADLQTNGALLLSCPREASEAKAEAAQARDDAEVPRVSTQEDGRGTGCLFFFWGGMKSYPILRYGDYMEIIYNIPTTWMSRGVGS